MKTKTKKYPDYLQVSSDGTIYVDIDKWKKSPQREREIEHAEKLRKYLQDEVDNINQREYQLYLQRVEAGDKE